jgi:hypothetical protein
MILNNIRFIYKILNVRLIKMEFEFNSQYLIFIGILLCLHIILFYLIYKLYLKTNDHSDKLDKLDKLLAEIFINKELLFDSTSTSTSKEDVPTNEITPEPTITKKTKKLTKIEEKKEPEMSEKETSEKEPEMSENDD